MIKLQFIKHNNKYIIYDPESLSLYSTSEDIGNILELCESRPKCMPQNKVGEEIYASRLSSSFEEKANCSIYTRSPNKNSMALCLIISHDCNLQCGYCYADHGTFGGAKKLMGFKTAKESIDKLLGETENNFILFFGGEPFLNFPLMKDVVDYGNQNKLNIKYATITNGTIINDSIQKFIFESRLTLQISLDGPKDINDAQRYGSFGSVHDRALETLGKLKSIAYPLSIKCTITNNSINKLNNIIWYLSSLGVSSIAFAEASLLPEDSEFFISDSEYEYCIAVLSDILIKNLRQIASGANVPIINPIFDILRSLITNTRKVNLCSVGREYVAVTADGDVYPCHGFVGIDEFRMGNVHDVDFPGKSYATIRDIFGKLNVYTSEECSSCWARFLCGGDCAAHSYLYNNNLSKPTKRRCIMAKSILEALLPEIAEIFQDITRMQNIIKRFSKSSNIIPTGN